MGEGGIIVGGRWEHEQVDDRYGAKRFVEESSSSSEDDDDDGQS